MKMVYLKLSLLHIELSISNILADNPLIKQAYDNLQTIPGIGKIAAIAMLAAECLIFLLLLMTGN